MLYIHGITVACTRRDGRVMTFQARTHARWGLTDPIAIIFLNLVINININIQGSVVAGNQIRTLEKGIHNNTVLLVVASVVILSSRMLEYIILFLANDAAIS